MRYIYILLLLAACKGPNINPEAAVSDTLAGPKPNPELYQLAKRTSDSIFALVEKVETKKMKRSALDRVAEPMQKRLDSLTRLLNYEQKTALEQHRKEEFNKLVDRKALRDKK